MDEQLKGHHGKIPDQRVVALNHKTTCLKALTSEKVLELSLMWLTLLNVLLAYSKCCHCSWKN